MKLKERERERKNAKRYLNIFIQKSLYLQGKEALWRGLFLVGGNCTSAAFSIKSRTFWEIVWCSRKNVPHPSIHFITGGKRTSISVQKMRYKFITWNNTMIDRKLTILGHRRYFLDIINPKQSIGTWKIQLPVLIATWLSW